MSEKQGERRDEEIAGDEDVVAQEEAAAGAEAGSIGGHRDESIDEAGQPVSEGGEGESEGYELSEQDLRDRVEEA